MSLQRAVRRILNGVLPGRMNTVDDTGPIQTMQIDHGPQGPDGTLSLHDKMPRMGEWGFFSTPPAGADVAVICVGGDRGNAVIVGTGHQKHRQKNVPQGDAGVHDVRGAYIWFKSTGPTIDAATGDVTVQNAKHIAMTCTKSITITSGSDGITIDAGGGDLKIQNAADVTLDYSGTLTINGDVQINGALSTSGDIVAAGDVTAGSISLEAHVHGGVTVGAGNTAVPH